MPTRTHALPQSGRKWLDSWVGGVGGEGGGGGGGVTVLIGTTPHLCPAPQLLCPVCPRNKAESAHKCPEANVKGKRAPNHVPREAGPRGRRGGGGTGLLREATPCGYLIPPGGMPAPELSPQPIPCHSA